LKNNKSVASVLALRTESGVYEHTKYICDRLLGAELISVSTITINEHDFIKSIIRNDHGGIEFVLSFSARLTNEGSNFVVDSHWNLDKYQEKAAYYNFQIWSNEIDDLYRLGNAVLDLLEVQRPIIDYATSTPPPVFVRKGSYLNGKLALQIVNSNGAKNLIFDAGYRETETGEFITISDTFFLNGDYITNLNIDTDQIFDIGFRIGDGLHTPDDIFMSDGSWGVDGENVASTVTHFDVTQNDFDFLDTEYPIERNIDLVANTDSYVAAYRSLTPRYMPVDLTAYNALNFDAYGTGLLEVTIMKQSIVGWEDQYKAYVDLSDSQEEYIISLENFESPLGGMLTIEDAVTLVFTMVSEDGEMKTKSLSLNNLRFSQEQLSNFSPIRELQAAVAYPNPMSDMTTIQFTTEQSEKVQIALYDQLGKVVFYQSYEVEEGFNEIDINLSNLLTGIYISNISSQNNTYNNIKLVVN